MTSHVVRVTSKGQATIPIDLRTKHGIRAPGLVRFVEAKGMLVVEPLATPAEMQGILKGKVRGKSLTKLLLEERRLDLKREERTFPPRPKERRGK
jgi:bifunctional DNA-binding transcriptional regulator/antitoxin component of YhaV-PrlF toxin-antitoxin module